MGIKEDVLALADDVESTIGGCYGCLLDKRGLCKAESDFDCNDEVCKFVAHRLRAIAEKDAENVTTVSAYDLLPEDEREAIAWVRDHGGLGQTSLDFAEGMAFGDIVDDIAARLGVSVEGLDSQDARYRIMPLLDRRLMPEGMEWLIESWPRFDDNEPLRWNDEYANGNGGVSPLHHVSLYADGRAMLGKGKTKVVLAPGERVKRQAPKVLDADGEEIRVGDTVYKVGGDGTAYVFDGMSDNVDGLAMLHHDGKPYIGTGLRVDQLTHEQPDDWSRWREDLELSPVEYADRYRVGRFDHEELDTYRDLVRRARKLAERGE